MCKSKGVLYFPRKREESRKKREIRSYQTGMAEISAFFPWYFNESLHETYTRYFYLGSLSQNNLVLVR
jgi:hypothetical protein